MSNAINLSQLIFDKIEALGADGAAAFFGRTVATVKKWGGGSGTPDVGAAQKILDEILEKGQIELPVFSEPPKQGQTKPEEPAKTEDHKPTVSDGEASETLTVGERVKKQMAAKKFSILCPVYREIGPSTVLSILGNWKATLPDEIRPLLANLDIRQETLLHRARNILATKFLATKNEWSFWFDSDIVAPFGSASWFKKKTGSKHADKWFKRSAIEQLTSRGKTIVSAVYSERSTKGRIAAQPGMNPADQNDRVKCDEIKMNGPSDELLQVRWVGFGCVAVHRKVFEDILATQEGVKATIEGEPHNFFIPEPGVAQGEDAHFCRLAYSAGHASFLDLSVHCGHVGKWCYTP